LASKNPSNVAAVVNFAGGRGGWAQGRANTNCTPEALARAAGVFGATARIPTLWMYAANDTFFAPELAEAMRKAFVDAGGKAEFVALDAWERDGHSVFLARGGSARWRDAVARFLGRAG
jgi:dienelactone hydrolase